MIQGGTFLQAIDNLGVKELKSIQLLGGKKKHGLIGDFTTVSIREIRSKRLKNVGLRKGDLAIALITQTNSISHRLDGQKLKFFKNSAFLLDKQKRPLGSRVGGLICKEFRKIKNLKTASLSVQIV